MAFGAIMVGYCTREGLYFAGQNIVRGVDAVKSQFYNETYVMGGVGDTRYRYGDDLRGTDAAYDARFATVDEGNEFALVNVDTSVTGAISDYLQAEANESRQLGTQTQLYGIHDYEGTLSLPSVITTGPKETIESILKNMTNETVVNEIGRRFNYGLPERFPKQSVVTALLSARRVPRRLDEGSTVWAAAPRKATFGYLLAEGYLGGASFETMTLPNNEEQIYVNLEDVIRQDSLQGNGYFIYNKHYSTISVKISTRT